MMLVAVKLDTAHSCMDCPSFIGTTLLGLLMIRKDLPKHQKHMMS